MAENATESSYTESPTKGTEMTDEELRHLREDETPGMESPTRAKTRTRSQILGELLRVRKEMEEGRQSIASAPSVSKNLSGLDPSQGSTRLPPIPKVKYPKMNKDPKYKHFNMTYDHVQPFRATSLKIVDTEVSWRMDKADLKKIHDDKYKRKMEEDYKRTVNDWNRMNLIEIYQLPPQSTFNVKKAIQTYLGNSKGSIKALNPLLKQTPRSSVSSASTKA
ncbi:hypothetical protein AC249_AIPGENE2721 [Exaiptasia diaphana]|nr:hypothetical protein AC249_AIPGENE2721 [Exaiptasia diaphana]